MNGSAINGERVVLVEVRGGRVNLKTGHVASDDASGPPTGNRPTTVVWGEGASPGAEEPDDIYDYSYQAGNIHLLSEREVSSLQEPRAVEDWFGAIYQERLLPKIHRALKRLKPAQAA